MNFLSSFEDQFYDFFKKLITAINEHVARKDYAIVTKRSKKNKKKDLKKIWFICDKDRKDRNENHESRKTDIRKTDCQFEIVAVFDDELNSWTYTIKNANHNHSSILSEAHSVHRRAVLTEEMKTIIEAHFKINIAAKNILSAIRLNADDENSLFKARNVYNQRQQLRQKAMNSDIAI